MHQHHWRAHQQARTGGLEALVIPVEPPEILHPTLLHKDVNPHVAGEGWLPALGFWTLLITRKWSWTAKLPFCLDFLTEAGNHLWQKQSKDGPKMAMKSFRTKSIQFRTVNTMYSISNSCMFNYYDSLSDFNESGIDPFRHCYVLY